MKSVISASCIFILIIIMILVSCWYTNSVTEEMLQTVYENEKNISKNDWGNAENEINNLENMWNKNRMRMSFLFDHSFVDKIDSSILKLKNTVQLQKKDDFFYENGNLNLLLLNLREQQKISAGNIF